MPARSKPDPPRSLPRCLSIECPHCGAAVDAYCWRAYMPYANRFVEGVCDSRLTASRAPRLPDYRNAIPPAPKMPDA